MTARELATALMAIWHSGDLTGIELLFDRSAIYDDFPAHDTYRGVDQISGYIRHVHTWASEVAIEVLGVHGDDNSAAAEWRMTAIQSAPIPGRLTFATNAPIDIRGVTIVEVVDGTIHRAADYIDIAPLVEQLGGTIALPTQTPQD